MDTRIGDFVTRARSYCSLVQDLSYPDHSPEFARQCLMHLLELSYLAMQLPDLDDHGGGEHPHHRIDTDTRQAVEASIAGRLPADHYWQVYSPLPLEQDALEPCVGSLADDLTDIWTDIKPGLLAIDSGSATLAVIVNNWKSAFRSHWGKHAADAIGALYTICCGFEEQLSSEKNDIRRISSSQRRPPPKLE